MKLYIKQHVFTFGDRFSIYDADGNEKYYAEGEVFTLGKKIHLLDLSDRELAYIEQKLFSFLPKYYISINGREIAEVIKEFTFFSQEYTVEGLGWTVSGDFFAHEYTIYEGESPIVTVSKEWFTFGDAYAIDIAPYVDEVTALAVVLVIDAVLSANRNN